jgi:hypothetical protein
MSTRDIIVNSAISLLLTFVDNVLVFLVHIREVLGSDLSLIRFSMVFLIHSRQMPGWSMSMFLQII